MATPHLRVGIGGWTYEPWRGTFYPKGLPHARELEYAASRLTAIEINSTFYSRQSPASWKKWADAAPEGFEFALKASRFCVTRPKLADAGEGIGNFFAQGIDQLEDKLGPTLWMLAARRAFDREDIAAFLELLPRQHRHAIEPRHESFRDPAFFDLCRDHNVAVVFGDDDEFPCIDADTANFRYARLQRMNEAIETGYDDARLDQFAATARGWNKHGYLFLINGAKLRAPAAALALQQLLGIVPAAA